MLARLQGWMTSGLVLLLIAVAGYAMVQDRALDDARRQRDEAVRARQAAERAIVVLADNYQQKLERQEVLSTAREDIKQMPAADREVPLSEIWRRSFRAADEIGGLK